MSMPIIKKVEHPISRCQSLNDVIESIALMEVGLSHIINAEGEKIQKIIKYDSCETVPICDVINVNDSVERMISSITRLELLLSSKLELATRCKCKCHNECLKCPDFGLCD